MSLHPEAEHTAGTRGGTGGTYAKGRSRAADILEAAVAVLVEHGYHNLSLRRVAESAGVGLGNLQHYFPTKEALVEAMLDSVIEPYLARFERIRRRALEPEAEFRALVECVFLDLNTRRTTVLFPELWSLANHEPSVTRGVERMYARYRQVLEENIRRLNPALGAPEARRLALFVSASIEGHTVFIGHGKPWKRDTRKLLALALRSFLWLIRDAKAPD